MQNLAGVKGSDSDNSHTSEKQKKSDRVGNPNPSLAYNVVKLIFSIHPPTQVPNCTECYGILNELQSSKSYLKIDKLAATAATATTTTAIIVIVSIKQSPFFS